MSKEAALEVLRSLDFKEILTMSPEQFEKFLVEEKKLFASTVDFKMFVLEGLNTAYTEDSAEWPIKYQEAEPKDPLAVEGEIIEGEYLTDEFAEGFKNNGV